MAVSSSILGWRPEGDASNRCRPRPLRPAAETHSTWAFAGSTIITGATFTPKFPRTSAKSISFKEAATVQGAQHQPFWSRRAGSAENHPRRVRAAGFNPKSGSRPVDAGLGGRPDSSSEAWRWLSPFRRLRPAARHLQKARVRAKHTKVCHADNRNRAAWKPATAGVSPVPARRGSAASPRQSPGLLRAWVRSCGQFQHRRDQFGATPRYANHFGRRCARSFAIGSVLPGISSSSKPSGESSEANRVRSCCYSETGCGWPPGCGSAVRAGQGRARPLALELREC